MGCIEEIEPHPIDIFILIMKSSKLKSKSTPKEMQQKQKIVEDNKGDDSDSVSGSESSSVYDSDVPTYHDYAEDDGTSDEDAARSDSDGGDDFEDQGSSDDDEDILDAQLKEDDDSEGDIERFDDIIEGKEKLPRHWKISKPSASVQSNDVEASKIEGANLWMHTDDLSSDDEDGDGSGNRIGRVPLHWYDDFEHVGYNAHGNKVVKTASAERGDRVDQAIANEDNMKAGKFIVHDPLNDKNVELSQRQLELIRRLQAGAFAHPEFEGNPDYIDYFSGVNPEVSGINADRYEPKSRFQPSKWEKLQVDRLLEKLEKGYINMDYLTGKIRDMNDARKKNRNANEPFLLWTGGEEDELNMRKGPQHVAAPKVPPPGHAESYIPPDEYIPTEEEVKQWEDMEVKSRPHGLLIPKKFPNLRSVGAYQHSVREAFERCLDLYLCPRVMKRRLNIDPESLVPQLPKAADLRPFPTAMCMEYKTPYEEGGEPPVIRCVSTSPDGRFLASGASDGYIRVWEIESGRLLKSWNLSMLISATHESIDGSVDAENSGGVAIKPVVCLQWNPNRSHHCLLAAVGKCAVVVATGTEGVHDKEVTDALLEASRRGGKVNNSKAAKSVEWISLSDSGRAISAFGTLSGPICILRTNHEMADLRWHAKGDYFVSVSPKAGAAAVLIHQLSKGNSQQPFSKAKGEAQRACFHPNKPFLFVASQQHVRIYHLVKQAMVKRKLSQIVFVSKCCRHC